MVAPGCAIADSLPLVSPNEDRPADEALVQVKRAGIELDLDDLVFGGGMDALERFRGRGHRRCVGTGHGPGPGRLRGHRGEGGGLLDLGLAAEAAGRTGGGTVGPPTPRPARSAGRVRVGPTVVLDGRLLLPAGRGLLVVRPGAGLGLQLQLQLQLLLVRPRPRPLRPFRPAAPAGGRSVGVAAAHGLGRFVHLVYGILREVGRPLGPVSGGVLVLVPLVGGPTASHPRNPFPPPLDFFLRPS